MSEPRQAAVSYQRPVPLAAYLLCAGLAVQALSLGWTHPTAFLLFLFAGGLLVAAGILIFLWTFLARPRLVILRRPQPPLEESRE